VINVTSLVFIFFISEIQNAVGLQNWRSGGRADHFTFRVDSWTPEGESIVEHIAGMEDYQIALATFRAACQRWPGTPITLRQGACVIEDSRRLRLLTKSAGREHSSHVSPPARLMETL